MNFNGAYNFGFSRPLVAKYSYNEGTGVVSYSDILQIGEGANTSINPSYSNAKLPGDNKIVEEEYVEGHCTEDIVDDELHVLGTAHFCSIECANKKDEFVTPTEVEDE